MQRSPDVKEPEESEGGEEKERGSRPVEIAKVDEEATQSSHEEDGQEHLAHGDQVPLIPHAPSHRMFAPCFHHRELILEASLLQSAERLLLSWYLLSFLEAKHQRGQRVTYVSPSQPADDPLSRLQRVTGDKLRQPSRLTGELLFLTSWTMLSSSLSLCARSSECREQHLLPGYQPTTHSQPQSRSKQEAISIGERGRGWRGERKKMYLRWNYFGEVAARCPFSSTAQGEGDESFTLDQGNHVEVLKCAVQGKLVIMIFEVNVRPSFHTSSLISLLPRGYLSVEAPPRVRSPESKPSEEPETSVTRSSQEQLLLGARECLPAQPSPHEIENKRQTV